METKESTWFEVVIRYDKTTENGLQKKVNEQYTIEAQTFGEAEEDVAKVMAPYVKGDMEIKKINRAAYKEIIFSDKEKDTAWFVAKVDFIILNEKTEKEKKETMVFLVAADTLETARTYTEDVLRTTMYEHEFRTITKSKTIDVIK